MKKQIRRISPHQNGKVFAVLMAISSLIFVIPMSVIMFLAMPGPDQYGSPANFMFLLFPFIYLVLGYLGTAFVSLIYNYLFRFIGGFEFEFNDEDMEQGFKTDAQPPG
jgi:ABC-type multidrug transport system fused ATPase/permease subunit